MYSNQNWFSSTYMRNHGCGPAAGANLLDHEFNICKSKQDMLTLMNDLYEYMKPHAGGVYPPAFIDGINSYLNDFGYSGRATGFWIKSNERKDARKFDDDLYDNCIDFIRSATSNGHYVGFLNLNNGGIREIWSWHWVTITSINGDKIDIIDNGKNKTIDFKQWYIRGTKRGGLVTIE